MDVNLFYFGDEFVVSLISNNRVKVSYAGEFHENINSLNEHGNAQLHTAIIENDLKALNALLQDPNIDVNLESYRGETPLLIGLQKFRSDDLIIPLIEAGCDPNASRCGQSPLHVAMLRPSTDIALELLKRGANVNVLDKDRHSPLHYAVYNNNLEGVCMLLYYGADPTLLCRETMTPFTYALYLHRNDIAQELYYYYDDFSHANSDGYTALHFATRMASPLAFDLVNAGVNVNCIAYYDETPLLFSTRYKNCEMFKLIWSKIDYKILLNCKEPFLASFVRIIPFTASEYLECLHLILSCPIAFYLLEELIETISFQSLLYSFHHFGIEPNDRMTIINICLSLGFSANVGDVNCAFELFGFDQDVEAFINSYNCYDKFTLLKLVTPTVGFILGMEKFSTIETSEIQNRIVNSYIRTKKVFNAYKYFSLSSYQKMHWEKYIKSMPNEAKKISKELVLFSEIPTLVELSRNRSYTFIHQKYNIKKPYQFHDVVRSLKLPPYIQEIIRFKRPIY